METIKKPSLARENPNSRKNLKPVQPGDPGRNPLGGRAHDQKMREWRNCTQAYVREIIDIALMGKVNELALIFNDEDETAMKRGLAKTMYDAVTQLADDRKNHGASDRKSSRRD